MRRRLLAFIACTLLSSCVGGQEGEPERKSDRPPPRSARERVPPPPYDARACLATLKAANTSYVTLADRVPSVDCPLRNTVALFSTPSDTRGISVANLGIVGCPVATKFVAWARYGVGRAAAQILGSPLTRIETFGSYSCRTVAGSGRMSAHSVAAAIDVSGFQLADGRRIVLKEDWNNPDPKVRQFLRVVHTSACKRFGTVLGPDYNEAHRDHFHLEVGDGSFCR